MRIAQLFSDMDLDKSGRLDRTELAYLAKQLGMPMTTAHMDAAMAEMDKKGFGDGLGWAQGGRLSGLSVLHSKPFAMVGVHSVWAQRPRNYHFRPGQSSSRISTTGGRSKILATASPTSSSGRRAAHGSGACSRATPQCHGCGRNTRVVGSSAGA